MHISDFFKNNSEAGPTTIIFEYKSNLESDIRNCKQTGSGSFAITTVDVKEQVCQAINAYFDSQITSIERERPCALTDRLQFIGKLSGKEKVSGAEKIKYKFRLLILQRIEKSPDDFIAFSTNMIAPMFQDFLSMLVSDDMVAGTGFKIRQQFVIGYVPSDPREKSDGQTQRFYSDSLNYSSSYMHIEAHGSGKRCRY